MKNRNRIFVVIPSVLACLALLPTTQAAPDPALPGFNTADGQNAFANVTTGAANTAVGWFSLFLDTEVGRFQHRYGRGVAAFQCREQIIRPLAPRRFYSTLPVSQNTAVGAAALVNNDKRFSRTAPLARRR